MTHPDPVEASSELARILAGPAPVQRIAGFRIDDIIGEGGMGIVYRAVQESLGRPVAVKVIRVQHDADAGFRQRFVRETRIIAQINHPNVVACYDAGEDRGRLYLAMELIPGGDLRRLVAQHGGRLQPAQALAVACDVAAGLVAIHALGLVHRDIKPANLLIAADGRIKIADLGLAKPLVEADEVTTHGLAPGTPAFMAPEQARNDRELDHRADIYSLGATLFFLLTGRAPFIGGSHYEVVSQILHRPIPDPATVIAPCPPAFSAIVRRAGAIDPGDRYPSAQHMLQDLQRARDVLPAATIRPTAPGAVPGTEPLAETVASWIQPGLVGDHPGVAAFRAQAGPVLRKMRSAAMSMSTTIGDQPTNELTMLRAFIADVQPLVGAARAAGMPYVAEVAAAAERFATQLTHWPQHLGPSVVRTLRQSIDGLERLLEPGAPIARPSGLVAMTVDDDGVSRATMGLALTGIGIVPVAVASGEEALALAESRAFTLVLCDVMMEGINGFELARRLRAMPGYARTPILLVTGLNDLDHSFVASVEGATDIIIKPFLLMELGLKAQFHVIGVDEEWRRLSGR